ncbi:Hsp20/alpha crystallin family protein [uncultured Imperialibacter sp.]|uniref:Hsp20/alpha crystallin family protein n=1 Tax=uncultured Imperialibacter sp. TaxID=1672639 RepID=UPI0030D8A36D|tara:strand:- start:18225 stop:18680 length:456 start_codon:yes stop_codon:yes gene_type:complete
MKLIRRNPNLFPEFPSVFDSFLGRDLFDFENGLVNSPGASVPAVNVKETEEGFDVEVAAPGFNKKDFHVEVNNNLLTISSEKEVKNEQKDENGRYTRREFGYSSFKRSFTLPENVVNAEKIGATYENGILHVSIPKREEAKPKPVRQIAIA